MLQLLTSIILQRVNHLLTLNACGHLDAECLWSFRRSYCNKESIKHRITVTFILIVFVITNSIVFIAVNTQKIKTNGFLSFFSSFFSVFLIRQLQNDVRIFGGSPFSSKQRKRKKEILVYRHNADKRHGKVLR